METQTLLRNLIEAQGAGQDPGLATFLATGSEDEVRLAEVVACVIAQPIATICDIAERVWEGFDRSSAETLRRRPFIEDVVGGVRLSDYRAAELTARFRADDPAAFAAVHRYLAETENDALEREEDPEERWFIRGRTAFYLAGIDPSQSVAEFGETFTEPPVVERTAGRLWLSALVERQAPLLSKAERAVIFFRGFRQYVLGSRAAARADFEQVVRTNEQDRYRAVALHLLGTMQRDREVADRLTRESVVLSSRLGIAENEIMARHTLSWSITAAAQSSPREHRGPLIDEAFALASLNDSRANQTQDDYLVAWCSRTKSIVEWLRLTDFRSNVDDEALSDASRIESNLYKASRLALEIGDLETACLAANDAVGVWRDIGSFDIAITEAVEFLDELTEFHAAPATLENLAKTLGSMQGLVSDAAQADQLRLARARVERMLVGSARPGRRRSRRRR